eukprot:3702031-Alexandrium_andersonii.AAC.1
MAGMRSQNDQGLQTKKFPMAHEGAVYTHVATALGGIRVLLAGDRLMPESGGKVEAERGQFPPRRGSGAGAPARDRFFSFSPNPRPTEFSVSHWDEVLQVDDWKTAFYVNQDAAVLC